VGIRSTPAVLVEHAHLFSYPHLQNPLAKDGVRYINSLIKPEHTELRVPCHHDAPARLGVAQIEGVFDPNLTPVWDVLHVNSPMLSGLTEGLGLHVSLFPFPALSGVRGRGEVHESVGFKSETWIDDSVGAAQIRVPCSFLCLAP
jgi:hypothetical protein